MKIPQSTLIYAHVRRDLVEAGASLEALLKDLNAKVRQNGGIVLSSGQILRRPIELSWDVDTYLDDWTSAPCDHPDVEWGDRQSQYFDRLWGISQPFQYSSEREAYDQFCISARDPSPYLVPGELILALIQTVNERRCVDCECHHTQAVYTSRHRVLCMGCGQLYRVLAEPLEQSFDRGITNEQWEAAFDDHGELIDDSLEIPVIDYRLIRESAHIWTTDAWQAATGLIEFYATGDEEEIRRYEATLPRPEDFLAAGWQEIPMPPSAAAQLADDGVDVDLWKNAEVATKTAARAYAQSRTNADALRDAVLSGFQAIELVLKLRLEPINPAWLRENNPSILRRLVDNGIPISAEEADAINELRRLRNKLQHAGASIGYRDTRRLLRTAFIFLDRFLIEELDLWLNHACDPDGWRALLQIPPIAANAEKLSSHLASQAKDDRTVSSITICNCCGRERMVWFDFGFRNCLYCREEKQEVIDDLEAGESDAVATRDLSGSPMGQ